MKRRILKSGLLAVFAFLFLSMDAHACETKLLYSKATLDKSSMISTIESAYLVDRPLDELIKSMDMQNWERCSPRHFDASDLMSTTVGESIPLPGSDWSGTIYELFHFDWLDRSQLNATQIENHLEVQTQNYPNSEGLVWKLDYRLDKSLSLSLNLPGITKKTFEGGVDTDEGFVTIEKVGQGLWKVVGLKRLRFAIQSQEELTHFINLGTRALMKYVFYHFGQDLLCCDPRKFKSRSAL